MVPPTGDWVFLHQLIKTIPYRNVHRPGQANVDNPSLRLSSQGTLTCAYYNKDSHYIQTLWYTPFTPAIRRLKQAESSEHGLHTT